MIQEANGILTFDLSKIDSLQFKAIANELVFFRHGSTILIKSKNDDKLICQFNPFDNTIFICDPRGYSVADLLGTKRFPVGLVRRTLDEDSAKAANAIQFSRDLSFPLVHPAVKSPESLKIVSQPQSYSELSNLLVRLSGFTPAKIEEYNKSGDIFCRFNPVNHIDKFGCFTCAIFIADTQNDGQIVGAMAADIILTDSANIDIYLRDEIVEQPCTLEYLFEAGRIVINQKLLNMNCNYQPGQATAFIRAASGKEGSYIALGCSPTNPGIYVIHGPRTDLSEMIDSYVKAVSAHQASPQKTVLQQYHHSTGTRKPSEEIQTDLSEREKRMFHFFRSSILIG